MRWRGDGRLEEWAMIKGMKSGFRWSLVAEKRIKPARSYRRRVIGSRWHVGGAPVRWDQMMSHLPVQRHLPPKRDSFEPGVMGAHLTATRSGKVSSSLLKQKAKLNERNQAKMFCCFPWSLEVFHLLLYFQLFCLCGYNLCSLGAGAGYLTHPAAD